MAGAPKKVDDASIIGLNSVGMSLGTISRRLHIHHTTVTGRLKSLGIAPADTRHAFMEGIYDGLNPDQQEWLIEQLANGRPVKDFVKGLIISEYRRQRPGNPVRAKEEARP